MEAIKHSPTIELDFRWTLKIPYRHNDRFIVPKVKLTCIFVNDLSHAKANPDKCHFICSSNEKLNIVIEDQTISNSNCEKLLGVLLDSKLTFKPHVDSICRKAGLKLNAISRIIPYMDFSKRRLLVNAFFSSQFNYCPLIWMCHNRMLNNRINRLHERCLRIIYNDKHTSFEELLEKDKSVSIHQKNLQVLATEMFKIY